MPGTNVIPPPPTLPGRYVTTTPRRFGAQGDGVRDDVRSLQRAVDWLSERGGGILDGEGLAYRLVAAALDLSAGNINLQNIELIAEDVPAYVSTGAYSVYAAVVARGALSTTSQALTRDGKAGSADVIVGSLPEVVAGDYVIVSMIPPFTSLPSGIDASQTTITLASTAGFNATGEILIGNERIAYNAISGNDLTGCRRGQRGTTAATHASGSGVSEWHLGKWHTARSSQRISRAEPKRVNSVRALGVGTLYVITFDEVLDRDYLVSVGAAVRKVTYTSNIVLGDNTVIRCSQPGTVRSAANETPFYFEHVNGVEIRGATLKWGGAACGFFNSCINVKVQGARIVGKVRSVAGMSPVPDLYGLSFANGCRWFVVDGVLAHDCSKLITFWS